MIAYACVYRRWKPPRKNVEETSIAAKSNQLLRGFLDCYDRSYFDWGDDPSLFAAHQLLGDVGAATWGVCRRDVRARLKGPGDFIVFFAGIPSGYRWKYYWSGLGTVGRLVRNRASIWKDPTLSRYRQFLNLLVRPTEGEIKHCEYFSPVHKDWPARISSPYVLFDPALSRFDIRAPLHVSTFDHERGVPDKWRTDDKTVHKLETLLFKDNDRRLRTSSTGFGHAKLRLHGSDEELLGLRTELLRMLDSRGSGSLRHVPSPLGYSAAKGCG